MNLEDKKNGQNEDQFFQFDGQRSDSYNAAGTDHSITDNAEPDYGGDLMNEGIGNSGSEEFDKEEYDNDESNDLEDDDLEDDDLEDDDLEDDDEIEDDENEDEDEINPNR